MQVSEAVNSITSWRKYFPSVGYCGRKYIYNHLDGLPSFSAPESSPGAAAPLPPPSSPPALASRGGLTCRRFAAPSSAPSMHKAEEFEHPRTRSRRRSWVAPFLSHPSRFSCSRHCSERRGVVRGGDRFDGWPFGRLAVWTDSWGKKKQWCVYLLEDNQCSLVCASGRRREAHADLRLRFAAASSVFAVRRHDETLILSNNDRHSRDPPGLLRQDRL